MEAYSDAQLASFDPPSPAEESITESKPPTRPEPTFAFVQPTVSSGLSVKAKVAIGVGVGIGVGVLCATAVYLLRKRGKSKVAFGKTEVAAKHKKPKISRNGRGAKR